MPELVFVVEGHGDVGSFPHLVAKIGAWLGEPKFIVNPIRSGGWGRIKKANGLERLIRLAATRPECTSVVIAVDLDDGCPVEERQCLQERVAALELDLGISIEICFCLREFEAWFLASLDHISARFPEYEWLETEPINNHHTIRDAKGRLRQCMRSDYGEGIDQQILVKGIEPYSLYDRDRSFRRFVKAVSGHDYNTLAAATEQ